MDPYVGFSMNTSPKELAESIMDRLISEGLLTEDNRAKLLEKLANGLITQEEWRLSIELANAKREDV
jgi:hypothetical protein